MTQMKSPCRKSQRISEKVSEKTMTKIPKVITTPTEMSLAFVHIRPGSNFIKLENPFNRTDLLPYRRKAQTYLNYSDWKSYNIERKLKTVKTLSKIKRVPLNVYGKENQRQFRNRK